MSEREALIAALRRFADGETSPGEARADLAGMEMPNAPAVMVKRGRWAVDGGYPLGAAGGRMAARDAIDLLEHP